MRSLRNQVFSKNLVSKTSGELLPTCNRDLKPEIYSRLVAAGDRAKRFTYDSRYNIAYIKKAR